MTNIKSLFFGFLLLTVGETLYAQTNKFDIGVEGSPTITFMSGNDGIIKNTEPTIGFTGGPFFQYNFMKTISLRTNIAFERKGNVMTIQTIDHVGNPLGRLTTHANYDYLTLPILVRATFGKKIQFFVNAGPYFGYLIKQNYIYKLDNSSTKFSDITRYKRFDTGITTGLGLSVPVNTEFALSFEIRNNLGLYNVSAVPVLNNGSIKTNSTNFLVGFTYKLGSLTSDQ